MRRTDREVTDTAEIQSILDSFKVCRIGMSDKGEVYIVPLNFGYSYEDGSLILYFHGAKDGRKIKLLKENNRVCFEMDGDHALVTADAACKHSYKYASIIGNGQISFPDTPEEKKKALFHIMKHQTETDFEISEAMAAAVAVFQLKVDSLSCKRHG